MSEPADPLEHLVLVEPQLQFFAYAHLRADLQAVSKPFGLLAIQIVESLPRNPERSAALRKLMEAKDCAVRALLYKTPEQQEGLQDALATARQHGAKP